MIDGEPVDPDTLIFPVAESLPMGWSWSLFFAQSANTHQLSRSLGSDSGVHVMTDRGMPLVFRPS